MIVVRQFFITIRELYVASVLLLIDFDGLKCRTLMAR